MSNPFLTDCAKIENNTKIRPPQIDAYMALKVFANSRHPNSEREVGIILPVGCGKSGLIAITPFAFKSKRTLIIAPGVRIATQLFKDFNPSSSSMFYRKCSILAEQPFPEPVEIRGETTTRGDLEDAHVVITNIQQLQGTNNRWLSTLPEDFFDLILFDEGHHSVAETWETLKKRFPEASIVNYSATPQRADGQLMGGQVLYSFPIVRAIEEGYVKGLKAVRLNPSTLHYVRLEDGEEVEVGLDEVRRLGEEDASFRRSIVTSAATLATIVDASIRELEKLRDISNDRKLKIIASALNMEHCIQIVEAYRSRSLRADFVHSREDSKTNERIMSKLENHELDVIVQVRKLGEGFDHPYLAVAAVFSIFNSLSPFVQFVGRIMRVIVQNDPSNSLNQGVVVFHAGANTARSWSDFQQYSGADQAYFDALLPVVDVDPSSAVNNGPRIPGEPNSVEVRAQTGVQLEDLPLIEQSTLAAIKLLQDQGLINFDSTTRELEPVYTTKQKERLAKRSALDDRVMTEAAKILHERSINPQGRELDTKRLGISNLIVIKSAIDRKINSTVGKKSGERRTFERGDLERIECEFDSIVKSAAKDVFDGK
ncbi:MAG: DEAD/DEAH box helicase [Proteobacteria bacterium]|nr:MAG: DEAD/DEAH box helicase [Pseudomonadota bacterium]